MQIADLKSTFLKLSRRPFIWSSEVQSWIHWCRPTTDWLLNPPNLQTSKPLNPPNLQTQLQLQGSKSAFPAFSDEAILPLAATLIPGWRRVNWISELDKPAPITGGSVKDVGKRQAGPWQAVTGTAMQIDFPQIPICHDFSKAYLDKVYFFKVYLSKLYLTGNTMQINFPQIAQFPPFCHDTATLQFFLEPVFSPKKLYSDSLSPHQMILLSVWEEQMLIFFSFSPGPCLLSHLSKTLGGLVWQTYYYKCLYTRTSRGFQRCVAHTLLILKCNVAPEPDTFQPNNEFN